MLDQLYYFSEVYRNRSISRAADFLHISRQALSHSVKGLGVEFFRAFEVSSQAQCD